MSESCVAFIVEDEEYLASGLKALVESLGHSWVHARTLVEAQAIIARGGFCYVLLDMQIPPREGLDEEVGCGETILAALRKRDSSRNAAGKHWLQIIVITGYSQRPEFVSRMYEMDADGFIAKPFGEDHQVVRDRIRGALGVAGREEHATCVSGLSQGASVPLAAVAPSRAAAPIVVDGVRGRKPTGFLLGGKRRELQDAKVTPFLRFVGTHKRAPGTWLSKQALGILRSEDAVSRIRKALAGAIPEGEEIIERDNARSFHLNPAVVVERVDWEALLEHPEAAVRKVAKEEIDRR